MPPPPVRRLLILAYYFPPVHVVGAQRLFHFYRTAQQACEQVDVITAANHHLMRHDPDLEIPDLALHLAPAHDLRTRLANKTGQANYVEAAAKRGALRRWFLRLRQNFPWVLWWGDGGLGYSWRCYRLACRLIREKQITHVFSSYRPIGDHLTARMLKWRFPQLVWIADFRDTPIDAQRGDLWWPALQRWWIRTLSRPADVVTTVSVGLGETLGRLLGRPTRVLYNGYAVPPAGVASAPMWPHFTLTYTGALYPHLQSAAPLLRALRKLLNEGQLNPAHLSLVYAGKDQEVWLSWLRSHCLAHYARCHGQLSLAEARHLQRQSQVNILLSWASATQTGVLTAKVFDYLAAGRPIVALVHGGADPELQTLVADSGGGRCFTAPGDPAGDEAIANWLLEGYRVWAWSGAWPWQARSQDLAPYAWSEQAGPFWDSLD